MMTARTSGHPRAAPAHRREQAGGRAGQPASDPGIVVGWSLRDVTQWPRYGRGGSYAIRARARPRRSEKLRTRRGICHMTEVRPRESVRRCGWYSCRSLRGVFGAENRLGRILAPAHVFRRHVLQMRCPEVTRSGRGRVGGRSTIVLRPSSWCASPAALRHHVRRHW